MWYVHWHHLLTARQQQQLYLHLQRTKDLCTTYIYITVRNTFLLNSCTAVPALNSCVVGTSHGRTWSFTRQIHITHPLYVASYIWGRYFSYHMISHKTKIPCIYFYLVCEAIDNVATPGLLCQPRVIVKMIVEKQTECRLAGETVFSEKTCPSATFVHHKITHNQTRVWTQTVGSRPGD
jgi:hypothetical protein